MTLTAGRELMRIHVEALFTHDSAGRLLRVNELDGGPAPRFFFGVTRDGAIRRFRHDVDDELRMELERACDDDAQRNTTFDAPVDASRYAEILARRAPVAGTWAGPAFGFPDSLAEAADGVRVGQDNAHMLHQLMRPWIPDVSASQPMFALVADGHAVAVCCSVRRTSAAHEAGVETVPAYRGRGYAAQVVTAWARAVRNMGRVPLYSTSWQNEASLAVARKLGLVHFGSDLHIT